jgi:hypothetical protein
MTPPRPLGYPEQSVQQGQIAAAGNLAGKGVEGHGLCLGPTVFQAAGAALA